MPSYIPPSRRNNRIGHGRRTQNNFLISRNQPPAPTPNNQQQKAIDIKSNVSFPTLTIPKVDPPTDPEKTSMDYLSSTKTEIPMPKKNKVKHVADGWLQIKKNKNAPPSFTFGEKSKKRYQFEDYLSEVCNRKNDNVIYKMINRYDKYETIDILLNGEKYINSWEYDNVMNEEALEREYEERLNMSSDDESSSDEEEYYEFN